MTLEKLFEEFKTKKIIVLGDVMIDAYLSGKVDRVSPEAPVPIINFSKSEDRLGGAANVALNLISLGANVVMSTVIGKDKEAETMLRLMEDQSISTSGIIRSDERQTTVKTRVIGNHQQLLRIDQEQTDDISTAEEDALLKDLEDLLKSGCDALIFQDYNKGVLTSRLIEEVIKLTKKYKVPTSVDPKQKNFLAYKGVTLFKPNLKELSEGIQQKIDFANDRSQFEYAVKELKSIIHPEIIFTTLSEHGVFIEDENNQYYIPAHKRMISDVSGAGDTVISVATLCLAVGTSIETLASMANLAGGIVCEYRGVVAIDADDLLQEALKIDVKC
ncbi:bifunctional heptose 7-phosphate kinase/heptose 1-phosphate adenyltransferase [Brumimicrobium aurantiacum]|uniref:D-glycero-beta-D-manno-heptose-7-phosphate kinase n=1 Tax=Brumimicrobium aurantiacum TaxID=1737063 RepID=A0A3E1EYD0_9FLAO|nr:bifunctional ADP-heptose synthase [Brumimicrobium aurantiacum]RFC54556.1 D-glycero-beta-D-manno-heptose-7-phosphate kinase [Brumimicrobium aurantiacum]